MTDNEMGAWSDMAVRDAVRLAITQAGDVLVDPDTATGREVELARAVLAMAEQPCADPDGLI